MQHFLQTISSISNVFLFPLLLPRFKGSHQQLPKYIKSFQRTYDKEKFQFLYLISYLQFDIIHLISAVNCFPSKFIILIATKNYMNFIFYFLFLTIFANVHIFLKIIPLSSVLLRSYEMTTLFQLYRSYCCNYANLDVFPF